MSSLFCLHINMFWGIRALKMQTANQTDASYVPLCQPELNMKQKWISNEVVADTGGLKEVTINLWRMTLHSRSNTVKEVLLLTLHCLLPDNSHYIRNSFITHVWVHSMIIMAHLYENDETQVMAILHVESMEHYRKSLTNSFLVSWSVQSTEIKWVLFGKPL